MYGKQDKRLSDTIIGEAILELLDEMARITNAILLLKLQTFLIAADETWRETATPAAIRSVQRLIWMAVADQPHSRPLCTERGNSG